MKKLIIALVMCAAAAVDWAQNVPNNGTANAAGEKPAADTGMRKQITELPFDPAKAQIVSRETRGNLEVITYEYEGKRYQEERGPFKPVPVSPAAALRIELLKKELGVDEQTARKLVITLSRCGWGHMPEG